MVVMIFLTQLLCAMVPCDPNFSEPEIKNLKSQDSIIDIRSTNHQQFVRQTIETNYIIETQGGNVAGYTMTSAGGHIIYAFEGIPYAEPPVGLNRFQPPIPRTPWPNILQAKKRGSPCLQLSPSKLYRTIGREDCLTLNVYSSHLPIDGISSNLPVLIWIHGGAFLFGEGGEYGPSYLLDKQIILVSFNYRLGILGFLSTGDELNPGNNGLKDQALAIKWVHDNIAKFGGDINKITLIGHSAGGASTHLHMMSNSKSKEYFQSAISLSGTAMNNWAINSYKLNRKYLNKLVHILDCPIIRGKNSTRNSNTVNCLRSKNPNTLVNSQINLLEWGPFPLVIFAPVIEKPNPTSFLTEKPKNIYSHGGVAKIPWIASYTKEEGLFQILLVYALARISEFRSHWIKIAPHALNFINFVENPNDVAKKVHEYYFHNKSAKYVNYARLSDPITDNFFIRGIHTSLIEHSAIAPTYGYIFDFLGKYNVGNFIGLDANEWGIGHTEDIFYIFNNSAVYKGFSKNDKNELELSQIMVNMLVNFATKKIPVYTDLNGIDQAIWTPIKPSNPYFLHIGRETKMISEPFKERRKFWDSLNIKDD